MVLTTTDLTFPSKLHAYLVFNGFFLFLIGLNVTLLLAFLRYPFQVGAYILLPYYTYCKVLTRPETKQGTRWQYFSKNFYLFTILRFYLGLTIHQPLPKRLVEAEQTKDAQFIIAVFPHGTASDYRVAMDGMLDQVFPNTYDNVRTLGASVLLLIPIVREIFLWTSGIDASRSVAEEALENGYSLVVLPGGEAEQIRTICSRERVYLKNRKGFLKLALRKGVPVVPMYVFGASDFYRTSNALMGPRLWLVKNLGICIPFAVGLWGSILCPRPVKTTIVVGEPLSFPISDAKKGPTAEELDKAHQQFCTALVGLFDEHKRRLGYGERTLELL
ncbi:diacylglycerol acyltransferase [Nitzschia inconspicua]|uniref:Acyltransferase n=1 Tax=Nitzschia inconspicua TaxID=303405 RepID=A0A9K3LIK9_9STRA|nr:diacylglycerol acyltransferase [Nitzschia inconspicua]